MFEQAFGGVLDVPVGVFGEHAADGIVDLGEAIERVLVRFLLRGWMYDDGEVDGWIK